MRSRLTDHFIPILFFLLLLVIGISVYRDYGTPWDESDQLRVGETNYLYARIGDPALLTERDRYHGPIFEIPLWRLFSTLPVPEATYMRHLAIFMIFIAFTATFYLLAFRLFRSSKWALLSVILLITSPRIFANSFYNSKDIPFLAAYFAALWSLTLLHDNAVKNRNWISNLWFVGLHSLLSALAIATRVPGVVLIVITTITISTLALRYPSKGKKLIALLAIYVVLVLVQTILFWPVLWHDPVGELINAIKQMSSYPWKETMLFQGEFISARDPVWFYIPVWIAITTPILQFSSFILGVFSLAIIAFNRLKSVFFEPKNQLVGLISPTSVAWIAITSSLLIPLLAIWVLNSVVYDGWRHLFFVYPAILLIGVFGLKTLYGRVAARLSNSLLLKTLATTIILVGLLEPVVFMVQSHPHENVYFNVFAGKPSSLRQQYDQDYWGLSYKQAIDYILMNDPSQKIRLFISQPAGIHYMDNGLPVDEASRLLNVEDPELANYFLSAYRWHPEDYPYDNKFYSITISGREIMVVYRISKP